MIEKFEDQKLYAYKTIDLYNRLCHNTINEAERYELISRVEELIKLPITCELYARDRNIVVTLFSKNTLSSSILAVHAFFQLLHGSSFCFGDFIHAKFYPISTLYSEDSEMYFEHLINPINKKLNETLDQLR